ncbi:MAG TPA: hypothetical protein VK612_01980 [Pyrinomonadaceae bacterium]|nr:hypothetical protein [Pyrinomonadaceae bacterium]
MQISFREHRRFHEVWQQHWPFAPQNSEPADVTEAREKFIKANDHLWTKLLYPLQEKFSDNRELALDEVIDFLEIEIPAYRCGYLKEYFLDHIKTIDLTTHQGDRLRSIAFKLCETNTVRREFRRWVNLMIATADIDFVENTKELAAKQPVADQRATMLMLRSIAKHRKDLAPMIGIAINANIFLR